MLARRLTEASGGTVEAVVFYGSHLHGAHPDRHSAVDFVVLVSEYDEFYRALRSAGALHRRAWIMSALARILPPNSIAFAPDDARQGMAKCLVINRKHLADALGSRRKDHFLVARMVQKVIVLSAFSPDAAAWVGQRIEEARANVLDWLAPFLDEPFDAESMGRRMLEVSYGAEIRPEAVDRSGVIFESQREHFRATLSRVLQSHAASGDLIPDGAGYRFLTPPPRHRRRALRWYFIWSNVRITARWFKHVVTFKDWLPYLTRKVERRTGQKVELSALERRWPLIFLWPRAIRTLRARSSGRPSAPVCGLRDTIAFIRNPAAFTAGPGLRLGDFYRVRIPGYRLHVVTDPAVVERILVTEAIHFEKSRIYWRELRRSMGESMGSLDGARWEYLHRVQRPFFTPKSAQAYLPTVGKLTSDHLQTLSDSLDGGREVKVLDLFSGLNARVVLSVLFGHDTETDPPGTANDIADRIADGHAIVAWRDRFPWRPFLGWFTGMRRQGERHKRFFEDQTRRLRRSDAASDPRLLLHALMQIEHDSGAPEFSPTLLQNEVTFHLGASTETQAAAQGWTLYLLWKHPSILDRLRDEIGRVAGDTLVSADHVPELTYTRQVVQETLRLYPPVYAVVRDAIKPADLTRHSARPGETFLISVYGLHRNPRLWDDAGSFNPDRFHSQGAGSIGRYQYLPFGAGSHVCIGQHMALPSMVLTVAQFAQRFDWTFSDRDIQPVAQPSLKPSGPFTARLTRRR